MSEFAHSRNFSQADARIRTGDPFITSGYRCAPAFTPRGLVASVYESLHCHPESNPHLTWPVSGGSSALFAPDTAVTASSSVAPSRALTDSGNEIR